MSRPETIYVRSSDASMLERLIASASERDAAAAAALDEELARATVVADDALPPQTVALDSKVRFQDEKTGQVREVTLVVPSKAALDEGRISILSPMGSALIGLGVDDHIDWMLPGGKVRHIRVLEVA
jgi:regulator of nucleoside diphosphate kinase